MCSDFLLHSVTTLMDIKKCSHYSFITIIWSFCKQENYFKPSPLSSCSSVPLRTPELSLTSRSPTDIQVSWQPLSAKLSRGRVSAYRLSFRTAADEQISSVELPGTGENSTQYLVQGLEPDTIYLLRIAVSTGVGWSQPSAWSSHRTPKTSKAMGKSINSVAKQNLVVNLVKEELC